MSGLSVQNGFASFVTPIEGAVLLDDESGRFDLSLLIETVFVMVVAVVAIMVFGTRSALGFGWLITPGILIVAALVPTAIKRRKFPPLGFSLRSLKDTVIVLGWTCVTIFPLFFCGLWLLKSYGFGLPVRPTLPQDQPWLYWLFYQFMYIALAEEVFFRGYVQGNILRLKQPVTGKWPRRMQWMSIGLSAACFAVAHVFVQGQVLSVLIFLPGLVLGWLFIRTRSLLAPILFHGLANVCYLLVASVFA